MKKLYAAKHALDKGAFCVFSDDDFCLAAWCSLSKTNNLKKKSVSAPWSKPCEFELQAAFNEMLAATGFPSAEGDAAANDADDDEALNDVFLIDGSGSVGEGAFLYLRSLPNPTPQNTTQKNNTQKNNKQRTLRR